MLRRHRTGVAVLVTLSALLNELVGYSIFRTLRVGNYDLTIFDQAVRSYSHFGLPVAMVKGVHNNFGPDFSVLGDHISPVLMLLAPLYWIHGGPTTLIAAQAVLFALAIVPLWILARRELGPLAAYAVAVAYALAWPVAQAGAFPFHEVAFAPLAGAILFERLSAWRHGTAPLQHVAGGAALLLLVKEDQGFVVAGLGLGLLFLKGRSVKWLGLALLLAGLAYTVVATNVLIPAFGGRSDYYWSYDRLGTDPPAVLWHVIRHPLDSLQVFLQPADVKRPTLLWLLALGALAPLLSPYLLAVLPLLGERMLSGSPGWWGTDYQYNAYLVVPLLAAGIDGAARLSRRLNRPHPKLVWAAAALIVGLVSVPRFAYGPVADRENWARTPDNYAALRAVATVPDGVLVEAPDRVGPQLTGRTRVVMWDRTPLFAPWVLADTERKAFPFCSVDEQRDRVAFLEQNGYREVFSERGYVVLHNEHATPQLHAPIHPCLS
jgi:uncharacterized membrane protein